MIVEKFSDMRDAAIDLPQELSKLQRFQADFANRRDVVILTPNGPAVGERS